MSRYSLTQVEDHLMFPGLVAAVANESGRTAEALSWIAEFDARKLYRPAAHPTMYAFLVTELNLSEDAALKRLRAARTAYEYPTIFEMVSDGRLHLSAVVMLAAHLTPTNASELLASASRKSKAQIELLLAERFPKSDVATQVEPVPATPAPPPRPATGGELVVGFELPVRRCIGSNRGSCIFTGPGASSPMR